MSRNRQLILRKRPQGALTSDCFELVERDVDPPRAGQIAVAVRWVSVDPYMRRRLDEAPSYAPSVALGAVMIGGGVGEVVASEHPAFVPGDWVVGPTGWQTHAILEGGLARKISADLATAYLGVLGMPGVTAWYGLHEIGAPRAGETVVVSAAAGAVGSVVGQLARRAGCRAIGIAGGPKKCAHVVEELGFDACLDYHDPHFVARLAEATPKGVDVSFENVGGAVMDAVLARLNPFSRVVLCGLISSYDSTSGEGLRNYPILLTQRVRMQGFIISDHLEVWPRALGELEALVRRGELRFRETIVEGLERAPDALAGLLRGENLGKQIVKVT